MLSTSRTSRTPVRVARTGARSLLSALLHPSTPHTGGAGSWELVIKS
nr:MAG TPA: hypothetical protein [Caudoviricetes sp.]